MRKGGATIAKYEKWTAPRGLVLLQGWARDGLTDVDISDKVGISRSTLAEWKKKYPEIEKALSQGKEVADYAVESSLYKRALAGDVTACIFWLKNRKPHKWRDKPEMSEGADIEDLTPLANMLK